MGGATVEFDTRNLDSLSKKLEGMSLSGSDRKKLLASLGVEIEAQTQERFETKLDSDGNRWKDIADKTALYYQKRFGTSDPGKGLLFRAFDGVPLLDTIESQVSSWDVLVGATKVYAAVHQFGWEKKNIPARPYLGISEADEAELSDIVDAFIREKTE